MTPQADRNLLVGILALQLDFITRDQLIAAMHAWILEKATPLDQILRRQSALADDAHALLNALVAKHLELHGGDPERSLAAISSLDSLCRDLKELHDPDIDASLVALPQRSSSTGTDATQTFAGDSSAEGKRFRILRPHARGGLGEVFVAQDLELHREVALKAIQTDRAADAGSRARFLLEAEVTGGLEHPGIVPVYGLGQYDDGRPFYAMRFIRGDSLKEAVDRFHNDAQRPSVPSRQYPGERARVRGEAGTDPDPSPRPSPRSTWERERFLSAEFRKLLGRFVDVCDAIEYAHSRGVLHRDLKPGNIMLGKYGETLVVDWGLAKAVGKEESVTQLDSEPSLRPHSGSGSSYTQMGEVVGTPAFMSPEQAAGRLDQLGPASDVYSLGATLYYVLTGQTPLPREGANEMLRKVERGEFPPPRSIKPEIPKPLEAICLRAMARQPGERYASPQALANDIEHYLADEPLAALPDSFVGKATRMARRHRPLVRAAAASLLLVAIVSTAALFVVNEQRRQNAQLANDNGQLAQERGELVEKTAKLYESERQAKDAATAAGAQSKELAALLSLDRGIESGKKGESAAALHWFARALQFQPETGDKLGSVARRNLTAWMQSVHALQHVLECSDPIIGIHRSSDSQRMVAGSDQGEIFELSLANGERTARCQLACGKLRSLVFGPRHRHIATIGSDGKTATLWDAQSGASIRELDLRGMEYRVTAFSSDEKLLAVGIDSTLRILDLQSLEWQPGGIDLKSSLINTAGFSQDSTLLFIGGWNRRVYVWDLASKSMRDQFQMTWGADSLAINADCSRIAVAGFGTLHLLDLSAKSFVPLTHARAGLTHVSLDPAGRLVCTCARDGMAHVWDMTAARAIGNPLLHLDRDLRGSAFSEDGRLLVTVGGSFNQRRGEIRIWRLPRAPVGDVVLKHDAPIMSITYSHDAELLAFFDNQSRIYVAARASGRILAGPLQHECLTYIGPEAQCAMAFTRDKRVLATASMSGGVCLWDWQRRELIGDPLDNGKPSVTPNINTVHDAIVTEDDKFLVVTGGVPGSGYMRVFAMDSGERIADSRVVGHRSHRVVESPNRDGVLVGGDQLHTQLWRFRAGEAPQDGIEHPSSVYALSYVQDGRILLAGYYNGAVQAWDVRTQKMVGPPLSHRTYVRKLSSNRVGSEFISVEVDAVRRWDTQTFRTIGPAVDAPDSHGVAFDPEGREILITYPDGSVRSRATVPPWDKTSDHLQELARHLTGIQVDEDGVTLALDAQKWKSLDSAAQRSASNILISAPPYRATLQGQFYHQLYANDLQGALATVELWRHAGQKNAETLFRAALMYSDCAQALVGQHSPQSDEPRNLQITCRERALQALEQSLALGYQVADLTAVVPQFKGIGDPHSVRAMIIAQTPLAKNLAYRAPNQSFPKATASYTSPYDSVDEANDGDASYAANATSRWTAHQSPSASDWLQIEFAEEVECSRVEIAIYDESPGPLIPNPKGGDVRTPEKYVVEYLDQEGWKPVSETSRKPETPVGRQWNSVSFQPVKTKKIRVLFTHQGKYRSGVAEIAVWP